MLSQHYERLRHIKRAIADIRGLLDGKSISDLESDRVTRLAFERCIEIISEASRHIPDEIRQSHHQVPWRQVADIGNLLRHAYHRSNVKALWSIYADDLKPLEAAIDAMLDSTGPVPRTS